MSEELYRVRLDYQAILSDGRAVSLSQYGEVAAIDAEAAILDTLIVFRDEREKRPEIVKVWGLKIDVSLVSDTARRDLEALLEGAPEAAPEAADTSTGHTDKNGSPIYEGDRVDDGHSVYEVRWDSKGAKWALVRVSGAYRYPPFHQVKAMVKVTAS